MARRPSVKKQRVAKRKPVHARAPVEPQPPASDAEETEAESPAPDAEGELVPEEGAEQRDHEQLGQRALVASPLVHGQHETAAVLQHRLGEAADPLRRRARYAGIEHDDGSGMERSRGAEDGSHRFTPASLGPIRRAAPDQRHTDDAEAIRCVLGLLPRLVRYRGIDVDEDGRVAGEVRVDAVLGDPCHGPHLRAVPHRPQTDAHVRGL